MPTVKEVITEITNPRRRNNLEARRLKLDASINLAFSGAFLIQL